MSYVIELETRLTSYYQAIGNADRATSADKRRIKLERIRRENVVEITLEPIDGLDEADFPFNWEDASDAGQTAVEAAFVQFYSAIAPKINVLTAQRALERCGQEHQAS